jgi:hypothetical protein
MDLRNHFRVWWRWKLIIGVGGTLALLLAILASFTPAFEGGAPTLKWRHAAVYTSNSRLLITQPGFPWGRATLPSSTPGSGTTSSSTSQDFASPDRFANLATIYAYLAGSAQVQALISPHPLQDQVTVTPQFMGSGAPLPLMELSTKGGSPVAAQAVNRATIKAITEYLNKESDASSVPSSQRVQLQVLNPPPLGALTGGRSPILSAVALILALVGTFMLVYILENLYPTSGVIRKLEELTVVPSEPQRPRAQIG